MSTDLTKEVMDGKHTGRELWVCQYSRPDLLKKPLRNVPPTKCIVRPNSEVKKKIYYSENHFAPIGKNGDPTAKVISCVDNTGYRMHCGNMIDTFNSESECIDKWNEQLRGVGQRVQHEIDTAKDSWESLKGYLIGKQL